MGGTFGCVGTPLSPMPESQFLPQLKNVLPTYYQNKTDCFAAPDIIDSSACTAQEWLKTIQLIQELQIDYSKFIIVHGTDTLSYASAVFSYFLAQSSCTVLTGSQYPLLTVEGKQVREETDAFDNLIFALEQVERYDRGVYLAFHHHLYHGHTTIKHHTTALHAFEGIPAHEEIITPQQQYIVTNEDITRATTLNLINWMMQPVSTEFLVKNLSLIANEPPHFLILQGFGTGNITVNEEIVKILQKLRESGCLPILTTQVTFGEIDQRYAVSRWVSDAQILTANTLGHAHIYAKILYLYLKHITVEQCALHWSNEQ